MLVLNFVTQFLFNFYGEFRVTEYGKQYNVEVFFPKMDVEGTYDVSGQVLLLPIKGSGPFTGTFCKASFLR